MSEGQTPPEAPGDQSFGDPRPPWPVASSLRLCLSVHMVSPLREPLFCLPLIDFLFLSQ